MTSSGGETPKSPDQSSMLDSDATPDNSAFRAMPASFNPKPTMFSNASPSKVKDKRQERVKESDHRRDSWWSRAAGLVSSPGRGEVPRGLQKDEKLVTKVQKKRRGETVRQLVKLRTNSMSDTEASQSPSPAKSKKRSRWLTRRTTPEPEPAPLPPKGTLTGWAEFLTAHPTLPQILSWYAQLTLNAFIISFVIFMLYNFYSTIRKDVDKKSMEAISELLAEVQVCARQYTENKCAPETRVPAMETVCTNWEKCMNRDTRALSRAKISVGMWAEIFNSFVEPISWKTMVCSMLTLHRCLY